MPVNPNIALGAQTPAPVNFLGQMGQMMALKAAAQDTEGYEGVKNAISGGMAPNDPRLLQYGKRGIEAYKAGGEGLVKQQEALTKSFANAREGLGMVRTPDELLAYSVSQFSDPVIGPTLRARGLTPETVAANLQKEIGTSGFDAVLKKSAMGLDKWYTDQTSRRNTDVSSGPGYMQANLAREKFKLEQQQQDELRRILSGGGAALPPSTAGAASGAGATASVATNNLAPEPLPPTAVAPQTARLAQIDAQINNLIQTGNPKALTAANALIEQRKILAPNQQLVQQPDGTYVAVNTSAGAASTVTGPDGKPLVGKLPPAPFESQYSQLVGKAAGERDVALVQGAESAVEKLATINETLAQLKTSDAITGFGADALKDVERFRAQFMADKKAGKRVQDTEVLNAMLGSEVFGMIQSLGIGARGLDTPAEREYLREVMTGTIKMDKGALIKMTEIRKNVTERAIKKFNEKVDKGDLDRFFKTQGIQPYEIDIPTPATTGDIGADRNIQSLLDKYK